MRILITGICGFVGAALTREFQERLEREFNQSIIMTMPSVQYRFTLKEGEPIVVDNPADWPLPRAEHSEVVSVSHYLAPPEPWPGRGVRVFNLARSYGYQTRGYYVSLLAEDGVVSGSYPIPNPYLSPNQLPLCQKCHDRLP